MGINWDFKSPESTAPIENKGVTQPGLDWNIPVPKPEAEKKPGINWNMPVKFGKELLKPFIGKVPFGKEIKTEGAIAFREADAAGERYPRAMLRGVQAAQDWQKNISEGKNPLEEVTKEFNWKKIYSPNEEDKRGVKELSLEIYMKTFPEASRSVAVEFARSFPYAIAGTMSSWFGNPARFLTYKGLGKITREGFKALPASAQKALTKDLTAPLTEKMTDFKIKLAQKIGIKTRTELIPRGFSLNEVKNMSGADKARLARTNPEFKEYLRRIFMSEVKQPEAKIAVKAVGKLSKSQKINRAIDSLYRKLDRVSKLDPLHEIKANRISQKIHSLKLRSSNIELKEKEIKVPVIKPGAKLTRVEGVVGEVEPTGKIGFYKGEKQDFVDVVTEVDITEDINVEDLRLAEGQESIAWVEDNKMHLWDGKEETIFPFKKEIKIAPDKLEDYKKDLKQFEGFTYDEKTQILTQYSDKSFAKEVVFSIQDIDFDEPLKLPEARQQVETLKDNLIKKDWLSQTTYDIILKKYQVINPKTGEWKKIGAAKVKDLMTEIHAESEIGRIVEPYKAAVAKNPELQKEYDAINKHIRGQVVKDPGSLESMRYYMQKSELIAKRPLYRVYETTIEISNKNNARIDKYLERLSKSSLEAKNIMKDKESDKKISQYISSKSNLKNKPEMPSDITDKEISLVKEYENIFKELEPIIRILKIDNLVEHGKPIAGYKKYKKEINKAIEIRNTYGKRSKELLDYVKTQEWGVQSSGYEPLKIMNPKIETEKIGPTAMGKSHIQVRLDIEYKEQDKTLLQRFVSYARQINNLYYLQPKINALVKMYDDSLSKFKNTNRIKAEVEEFISTLKGYNMDSEKFWSKILARLYSQAMRNIILPSPVLSFRNILQNAAFAPDKSILFDPRNKAMTEEDFKYFKSEVTQMQSMINEFFMLGEKPLPGLGFLTKMIDKVKIYPYSDLANRYAGFWGRINEVRRVWSETKGDIGKFIKKSHFRDMTPTEQKYALGVMAKDGEQDMFRYMSKVYVDNIHFLYQRAQRSPAEMGSLNRVMSNLALFPRAYWERLLKAGFKLKNPKTPTSERYRSLKVILSTVIGGVLVGEAYKKATGRTRNPYNPLYLMTFRPGGLTFGTITAVSEVTSNIALAASGDKRAINALATGIPRAMDMFIPFYDIALRGAEAVTDTKNVDRLALRKIRELIDKEYKVRGGAYKIKRDALQKWQYFIGGAGVDQTIREKAIAEKKAKKARKGSGRRRRRRR